MDYAQSVSMPVIRSVQNILLWLQIKYSESRENDSRQFYSFNQLRAWFVLDLCTLDSVELWFQIKRFIHRHCTSPLDVRSLENTKCVLIMHRKILLIPSETAFFSAVVISSDIFKTVAYVLPDSNFCLTAKKPYVFGYYFCIWRVSLVISRDDSVNCGLTVLYAVFG